MYHETKPITPNHVIGYRNETKRNETTLSHIQAKERDSPYGCHRIGKKKNMSRERKPTFPTSSHYFEIHDATSIIKKEKRKSVII
jgi:hypothetical protein